MCAVANAADAEEDDEVGDATTASPTELELCTEPASLTIHRNMQHATICCRNRIESNLSYVTLQFDPDLAAGEDVAPVKRSTIERRRRDPRETARKRHSSKTVENSPARDQKKV